MKSTVLSRRRLLAIGGGLAVVSLTGCDALSTDPAAKKVSGPPAKAAVLEAPDLASQVKAGKLPALAKRIPAKPLIVDPAEREGAYGGTWNAVLNGPSDDQVLLRTVGYENLMRWDVGFSKSIPNIAESVETSADGLTFTFHLRAGMKWSDGHAFTADDIMFAYDDMFVDEDVWGPVPQWLMADGKPAVFKKVDDHTFQVTFAVPNGLFLDMLATVDGRDLVVPRHYVEQFHKKYNPDVEAMAKEREFADWIEMFNILASPSGAWTDLDRPSIYPWIITKPLGESPQVEVKRNPYYWKVDPAGRQLPYIDSIVFDVIEDIQVILLKFTNGELHLDTRHVNTLENKPVLAQHREKGEYDFFDLPSSFCNQMVISLNLNHKDQAKRRLFQNKDFRIGLSHAINRPELIEAVYQGQGEPFQVAPRPESDFYDEEMAKQFTEFDLDEANRRLDGAGLTERDGADFRLGPDGKRLRIFVEYAVGKGATSWTDALELVKGYWKAAGIDMQIRPEDADLWNQRTTASDHDASVAVDGGALNDGLLRPRWVFPWDNGSKFAVLWGSWYAGLEPNEEPTGQVRKQMDLYRQMLATKDEAERADLFRQVLAIAKEEFYSIGTVLPKGGYGVKRNDLHNVPTSMLDAGTTYLHPGPGNPAQFFIEG